MGIAKKNRRKLTHCGVPYIWWVLEEFEPHTGASLLVTVASEDKKFLVNYFINQVHGNERFLTVLGPSFEGPVKTGGVYKRFACPKFEDDLIFTPKHVVKMIDWCMNKEIRKDEVDYLGKPVSKVEPTHARAGDAKRLGGSFGGS